ncbi:hypothetical protein [Cellulosimicrobium funkei]|uniref:hypothetical protein n=1 Tax=Cellulosimicrobium funkei TaxID=264251 RepID=UPI0036862327
MPETLAIALITAVIGSAGIAGLVGAGQQITRSARLRSRVSKSVEMAKLFEADSVAANATMLTARDAALELCARRCVTFTQTGMLVVTTMILLVMGFALGCFIRFDALADQASGRTDWFSEGAEPNGAPGNLDILFGDSTFWMLILLLAVAGAVAVQPWERLRWERARFVERLLNDPELLRSATSSRVRIEVSAFAWLSRSDRLKARRFDERMRKAEPEAPSGDCNHESR